MLSLYLFYFLFFIFFIFGIILVLFKVLTPVCKSLQDRKNLYLQSIPHPLC